MKPENVLIETDPAVKVQLTDFGIAKILDAQGVTSTGQVLGSPAHMAPEQIEGGEVDARADVFGLGVLLYECMVGHLPFEGKNPAQVLRRVLEGSYAPADRERPAVGAKWTKVLAHALAKDAADRFASAEALTKAMGEELESLGIADSGGELKSFFADPEAYRASHRTRLVAALTRRGEQARKAGNLHAAAADFNRALVYAPQDPTLLKLIGRLRRGRATRRVLFALVAGSAVAAVTVLAVSLGVRNALAPATTASATPAPSSLVAAPPSAEAVPVASARAALSAPVVAKSAAERSPRHTDPIEPAAPREVTFVINPKGALVSIDDGPEEELFLKTKHLSVGAHTFRAKAPAPSTCCDELRRTEDIKPDDGSGTPQKVSLSLHFRDAKVSAPGAPADAQLRCPVPRISGSAKQVFLVKMTTLEQDVSCELEAPGVSTRQSSITLRAGELTAVPWSLP